MNHRIYKVTDVAYTYVYNFVGVKKSMPENHSIPTQKRNKIIRQFMAWNVWVMMYETVKNKDKKGSLYYYTDWNDISI